MPHRIRKLLHQTGECQRYQMKQHFLPIRTSLKASKVQRDKVHFVNRDIPSSPNQRKNKHKNGHEMTEINSLEEHSNLTN